ncbi:MAG: hypothetical protein ABJI69_00865 [Balneola sp.]
MILQELLYRQKWVYILFVMLCAMYAAYAYYDIVLDSQIPFKIKAEGLILDENKKYFLTNYQDWNQSLAVAEPQRTVAIRYQKNKSCMPNTLGVLSNDGQWRFNVHPSIQLPISGGNPFLPYVRLAKRVDGAFTFYRGNQKISSQSLEQGLIFNFPAGGIADRVQLQIEEYEQRKLLEIRDDGLGISYTLPDTNSSVEVLFNAGEGYVPEESNLVFHFDDVTPEVKGRHLIEVDPISWSSYTLRIIDPKNKLIVEKKTSGKSYFEIESILFSIDINQKYGAITSVLFGIQLVLLIAAALFFISCLGNYSENPIQESLLIARILFNAFLLLGLPLFMMTFDNYPNSVTYDAMLFGMPHLLNLSYGLTPLWRRSRVWNWNLKELLNNRMSSNGWSRKYLSLGVLVVLFVCTPLFLVFGGMVANERVLGLIPTLHFQKVLIIVGYIVFTSENIQKYVKKMMDEIPFVKSIPLLFIPNLLVVIFSLLISIATGDFGSFLFVVIAISVIEVVKGRISIWYVLAGYGGLLLMLLLLVSLDIGLSSRKLYRLVFSFSAPFSDLYNGFNQADRESLTYLWFNVKNMVESHPFGLFGDLKILDVSKSVAHSDYAFHWSTMIGGIWFWGLCLIGLLLLLTHLIFVLKATIFPMKASGKSILALSKKRLTIILSFWLSITIIQFCYQVFSNFMLPGVILTGIPMPFISVGRGDFVFAIILIVGLELIFYRRSFIEKTPKGVYVGYSYRYFNSAFINGLIIVGVIIAATGFKINQIKRAPDKVEIIPPQHEDERLEKTRLTNSELIDQALMITKKEDLTNLPVSIKKKLKELQYTYYTASPAPSISIGTFNTSKLQIKNSVSWKSHYNFDEQIVSGPFHPYGQVTRKRYLWNDGINYTVSNEHYRYLDYRNDSLVPDLSAQINATLEEFAIEYLPDGTKLALLIAENATGQYLAQSQFPSTEAKVYQESYYVGSVKKGILLDVALSIDSLKYAEFTHNGRDIYDWIKYSDYEYSGAILQEILDIEHHLEILDFSRYLDKTYKMEFHSGMGDNAYSDRPRAQITNYNLLASGGLQPYSLTEVVSWYITLQKRSTTKPGLQRILHAPLTNGGTAEVIADELRSIGQNPSDFIAKTGTLELFGENISSSMVLSNKRYTIAIMMTGESLPSNKSGKTAKFLMAELLPLFQLYDVLAK